MIEDDIEVVKRLIGQLLFCKVILTRDGNEYTVVGSNCSGVYVENNTFVKYNEIQEVFE